MRSHALRLLGGFLVVCASASTALGDLTRVNVSVDPLEQNLAINPDLPQGKDFLIEYRGTADDQAVRVALWPRPRVGACGSEPDSSDGVKQHHWRHLARDDKNVFGAQFPPLQADLAYCIALSRRTAMTRDRRTQIAADAINQATIRVRLGSAGCQTPDNDQLRIKLQEFLETPLGSSDFRRSGSADDVATSLASEIVGRYQRTEESRRYRDRARDCDRHAQDLEDSGDDQDLRRAELDAVTRLRRPGLRLPGDRVWVAGAYIALGDLVAGGQVTSAYDQAIQQLEKRKDLVENARQMALEKKKNRARNRKEIARLEKQIPLLQQWIVALTRRKDNDIDGLVVPTTTPDEMRPWLVWDANVDPENGVGGFVPMRGLPGHVQGAAKARRAEILRQIALLPASGDRFLLGDAVAAFSTAIERHENTEASYNDARKLASDAHDTAVEAFKSVMEDELGDVSFVSMAQNSLPVSSRTPDQNSLFSVDAGMAGSLAVLDNGGRAYDGTLFFYGGINIHLAAVQREIGFDQLHADGWWHRLRQRTSLTVGLTLTDPEFDDVELDRPALGIFPILAVGYRVSHYTRLVAGAVIFRIESTDPFSDDTSWGASPFLGASIDIDAITELKKLVLGKK